MPRSKKKTDTTASPKEQTFENNLDTDESNTKLREAAQLTFIFNKTVTGEFINIFKPSEIISEKFEKWQDLIQFYENWLKENSESSADLLNPEEEMFKYIEKAVKLAKDSYQEKYLRYVNPMTFTVDSAPSVDALNTSLRNNLIEKIKAYITDVQSLPVLNEKGWNKVYEETYKVTDNPALTESESVSVKDEFEPNFVVSADTEEAKRLMDVDINNEKKNTIFTKQIQKGVQMQVKPYDILRMRDYLRILRRLWNLSRLHGGKEITTFDENWDVKNHPYLKNHLLKEDIYRRCQQTFEVKGIKRKIEND